MSLPAPALQSTADLSGRFERLDSLLLKHRNYWQFRPFALKHLPWQQSNPDLCDWLESLDLNQLEELEKNPKDARQHLGRFIEDLDQLDLHTHLPVDNQNTNKEDTDLPAWMSNHIPGRKWQQIQAFEQTLDSGADEFLEWCAGKGHLGRLINFRRNKPITSIEINPDLCRQGQHLATKRKLDIQFKTLDALADQAANEVTPDRHVVALHACGDLHLTLIRHAIDRHPQQLSISPCCYHLIESEYYSPLSKPGQRSALQLDHHDLRMPLQQTVTAAKRIDKIRQQEVTWRLAFDLLQRHIRKCDQYLNTPSIAKSLLNGSFADYCRWMADKKELTIPATIDFDRYELAGAERYVNVQRMELVRHLYRRPLELWLVLDRAISLQEAGYKVDISEFCDYQLTPRNILISAQILASA